MSILLRMLLAGLFALATSCTSLGPDENVRLAGVLLDRHTGEPVSNMLVTLEVWVPGNILSRISLVLPSGTVRIQDEVRTSASGEFEFFVPKRKQYYGFSDRAGFVVDVKDEPITDLLLLHEAEKRRGLLNCQDELEDMERSRRIEPLVVKYCTYGLSRPGWQKVKKRWDELVRKYGDP